MGGEGATDAAIAADHIEYPGRQVGLGHQFGELEAVVRRFFAGFDHDGVAGEQRRGHLAGDQKEREVPRQDAGHHTQGFAEQEDIFIGAVAGDDLAFNAARPLGHVVEVVGGEVDFHFRQAADLALLQGNGARQVGDVFPQLGGDAAQVPGTFDRRFARPVFLRMTCGSQGLVDVFGGGRRDLRQQDAGSRVQHIQVGIARGKAAVDEVLVDRYG
eukprot:gene7317-biopygen7289